MSEVEKRFIADMDRKVGTLVEQLTATITQYMAASGDDADIDTAVIASALASVSGISVASTIGDARLHASTLSHFRMLFERTHARYLPDAAALIDKLRTGFTGRRH